MEKKSAVSTARLLRVLVYIAMVVNVICLPCVPFFALKLFFMWQGMELAYCLLLMLFFWVCGICTLVILWQAKRILNTILVQEPFQMANAKAMHRAAVSCWIISLTSLVRCVAEVAISSPVSSWPDCCSRSWAPSSGRRLNCGKTSP